MANPLHIPVPAGIQSEVWSLPRCSVFPFLCLRTFKREREREAFASLRPCLPETPHAGFWFSRILYCQHPLSLQMSPQCPYKSHVPLSSLYFCSCVWQSPRTTPMCLLGKSPWRHQCLRYPCRTWWWRQELTCYLSVSSPPTPHPKVSCRES